MKKYNYNRLKGKIKEKFTTQSKFAECLKISKTSLSNKLNNKCFFSQDEIENSINIFNLNPEEVIEVFFNQKVDK